MNNTQLIMITKQLYPDKDIFSLSKKEQNEVLEVYYNYN